MRQSSRIAKLALVLLTLPLEAHGAESFALDGRLTAESPGSAEGIHEVALRAPDTEETSVRIKAIFHDVLEAYGYRVDPLSNAVLTFQWSGPFGRNAPSSQVQAYGQGGSRTAPSLGFSLTLAMPSGRKGDLVYTLGCRLSNEQGVLWKAKAVATSASRDSARVARVLVRQLIHHLGSTVEDTGFRGPPTDSRQSSANYASGF